MRIDPKCSPDFRKQIEVVKNIYLLLKPSCLVIEPSINWLLKSSDACSRELWAWSCFNQLQVLYFEPFKIVALKVVGERIRSKILRIRLTLHYFFLFFSVNKNYQNTQGWPRWWLLKKTLCPCFCGIFRTISYIFSKPIYKPLLTDHNDKAFFCGSRRPSWY